MEFDPAIRDGITDHPFIFSQPFMFAALDFQQYDPVDPSLAQSVEYQHVYGFSDKCRIGRGERESRQVRSQLLTDQSFEHTARSFRETAATPRQQDQPGNGDTDDATRSETGEYRTGRCIDTLQKMTQISRCDW